MHVRQVKLKVTKQQRYKLNKMFYIAYKIYVICVKKAQKELRLLKRNQRYKYLMHLYGIIKQEINKLEEDKSKLTSKKKSDKEQIKIIETQLKENKNKLKNIKSELNKITNNYCLNRTKLEKYLTVQSHKYKHILTSSEVQRIADNVAKAVNKYLYGNGKAVHIKKYNEFNTIAQKADNGFKYNGYDIIFMNQRFKLKGNIKIKPDSIATIELNRIEFNSGYEYYIKFIIKEGQPQRLVTGKNEGGIDPGVSTMAIATDDTCILEELAPKCKEYNKKIAHLQKLLDISIRRTNPSAYNAEGKIKKGTKLKYSKHAKYLKRKIRVLYRKKSNYTECKHRNLANRIIKNCNRLKIETMDYKALAKRSKNVERSDKLSTIKLKDGTEKEVYKYKKRKRFGKSINDRSPGLFIKILTKKCELYEVKIRNINTSKVKASKYNHKTNKYEEHKLSERTKQIGKDLVQRDLYSAFLIKNVNDDLETIDRSKCKKEFKKYLENQEKEITRIKNAGIKNKNFGF